MEEQHYRFHWPDIEIEAVYTLLKWDVIAHLGEMPRTRRKSDLLPIGALILT